MQKTIKRMACFGSGIFILVGAVILIIVINDIVTKRGLLEDVRDATGVVLSTGSRSVETGSGPNRTKGVIDYAEIEYSAADGNTYVFEHTYGLIQGTFEKGDKVQIYYLSDDNSEALVNSFSSRWVTEISMLIAAFFFVGAGILVYKVMVPKKRD